MSGVELRAVVARLRRQHHAQLEEMRSAIDTTSRLMARGLDLRDRCRETRGTQASVNAD